MHVMKLAHQVLSVRHKTHALLLRVYILMAYKIQSIEHIGCRERDFNCNFTERCGLWKLRWKVVALTMICSLPYIPPPVVMVAMVKQDFRVCYTVFL